ncbi:hypothetical protein HYDPIDRAFT_185014 [Hydnomerulius pinastri MD-312]|nr:hypothetical protein HYDPIDRAFT_185014 [Hydnomerulius pinastri MD-312]
MILLLVYARSRKEDLTRTRTALQAFQAVITPTCSLWPSRYTELAKRASTKPNSLLVLSLEMLMEDIVEGVIEMRDPINDLVELVGSGAKVYGWTICTSVEWKWSYEAFEWWLADKPNRKAGSAASSPEAAPSWASTLLLHPFATTSPTNPLIDLDHLPSGNLPLLSLGSHVTLEFTSLSPRNRTLCKSHVISTLPFLLSQSGGLPRRPRSLLSVLESLSRSNAEVDTVTRVSVDYEHALRCVHHLISAEREARGVWVEAFGVRVWRRDMFLLALEAALVQRGWIERWAVEVSAK